MYQINVFINKLLIVLQKYKKNLTLPWFDKEICEKKGQESDL